jgi:hypothetical protein
MKMDLTKYDNIIFHDTELVNKKIKAYMLIFDYQCEINNLSLKEKIELYNSWEKTFMMEEFYEIIPCLIHRKSKLELKLKYDNMSAISKMVYKLSDIIASLGNKKG